MDKVRLAMVGCGMMGQSVHLQNFLKTPKCEVVAICDQDAQLAQKVAERYHVPLIIEYVDLQTYKAALAHLRSFL